MSQSHPIKPATTTPVLIFSGSFGDGHNTAARGVQSALRELPGGGVEAPILDIFSATVPRLYGLLCRGYVWLTTHFPRGWQWLYDQADDMDPTELGPWLREKLLRELEAMLRLHRPQVVLSTYPLYAHLLAKMPSDVPKPRFVGTIITDSLEINSVWTKAPCDLFFLTDVFTEKRLLDQGLPPQRLCVTGFPTAPELAQRTRSKPLADGLRVLVFISASARRVRAQLRSLLADAPCLRQLTIVMGRHEKRLRSTVASVTQNAPCAVTLFGWTQEVPRLLAEHDLVLSKAGGATTHECLALGTPLLITHAIPGQEEGNAELLNRLGCGWRHEHSPTLGIKVQQLWSERSYHAARERLAAIKNAHGAQRIAEIADSHLR